MLGRVVDGVQVLAAMATVVFIVLLLTAQPTSETVGLTPGSIPGRDAFVANCAGCHNADGSGGIGPALAGPGTLERFADSDELVAFVSVGVPGRMPGFETRLTPDEIRAVNEFVWAQP